eukprot:618136-Hanusia_phi.AAC.1
MDRRSRARDCPGTRVHGPHDRMPGRPPPERRGRRDHYYWFCRIRRSDRDCHSVTVTATVSLCSSQARY